MIDLIQFPSFYKEVLTHGRKDENMDVEIGLAMMVGKTCQHPPLLQREESIWSQNEDSHGCDSLFCERIHAYG
jgi:hypothetical protein